MAGRSWSGYIDLLLTSRVGALILRISGVKELLPRPEAEPVPAGPAGIIIPDVLRRARRVSLFRWTIISRRQAPSAGRRAAGRPAPAGRRARDRRCRLAGIAAAIVMATRGPDGEAGPVAKRPRDHRCHGRDDRRRSLRTRRNDGNDRHRAACRRKGHVCRCWRHGDGHAALRAAPGRRRRVLRRRRRRAPGRRGDGEPGGNAVHERGLEVRCRQHELLRVPDATVLRQVAIRGRLSRSPTSRTTTRTTSAPRGSSRR